MSLVLESKPEVETRLQAEAEARRLSVEEYVESLLPIEGRPFHGAIRDDPERFEEVIEIVRRIQALPILDHRTPEEIIGFDENGLAI